MKQETDKEDFPGSPVVKTSPSNAGGAGSIPGWGAKIPCLVANSQNRSNKLNCNKFNKDLKNGAHQKQNRNEKQNKAANP